MSIYKVGIVKMEESSGNVQFFVRTIRTDLRGEPCEMALKGTLEYSCHQTKHGLSINDCIQRAVFDAGYLLRFFDAEREDLFYGRFTEQEIEYAKVQRIPR